jgi:hypothetical protein
VIQEISSLFFDKNKEGIVGSDEAQRCLIFGYKLYYLFWPAEHV